MSGTGVISLRGRSTDGSGDGALEVKVTAGFVGTTSSLTSTTGVNRGQVTPFGTLAISPVGRPLFSEPFDGATIDTTYRWNAAVLAGGGTVTQASGVLTIATSTTANNAGALTSIERFNPVGAGFLAFGAPIQLEVAVGTNTHRFFGVGTPNASFTAATPLADAYGWEVDITGALNCVTYASNVRTIWAVKTMPTDGAPHILACYVRANVVYFHFDNLEEAFAVGGYQQASTSNLPVRLHCINHTAGPSGAPTFKCYGVAVVDFCDAYNILYNGQTVQAARSPGKIINLTAVGIATEQTIWTPAAGKKFRILGYNLTSGTVGGNVTLKDNTAGTTCLVIPFGAATANNQTPPNFGNGYLSAVAGNVLTATGSATQTLSGYIYGCEEA